MDHSGYFPHGLYSSCFSTIVVINCLHSVINTSTSTDQKDAGGPDGLGLMLVQLMKHIATTSQWRTKWAVHEWKKKESHQAFTSCRQRQSCEICCSAPWTLTRHLCKMEMGNRAWINQTLWTVKCALAIGGDGSVAVAHSVGEQMWMAAYLVVPSSVQYLACQGLAVRGHWWWVPFDPVTKAAC